MNMILLNHVCHQLRVSLDQGLGLGKLGGEGFPKHCFMNIISEVKIEV